ncbi:MAG TPA: hypothetical protein VGA79_01325 [Desulfobaccales bacterium]|jgi:hypothetical protein
MGTLDTKSKILRDAGYIYSFDREVYFNRRTKKIFSLEFIEDRTEQELQSCLNEKKEGEEWHFYFSYGDPSDTVKHEIQSVLE